MFFFKMRFHTVAEAITRGLRALPAQHMLEFRGEENVPMWLQIAIFANGCAA